MVKERLVWIDALKGWLMILVVIGHAIQTELGVHCEDSHLWNLIYSFHMLAFMAVSGWLFYQKPIPKNVVDQPHRKSYIGTCSRRCSQLIIPYLVWSLLVFLLRGQYSINCFLNIVYMSDSMSYGYNRIYEGWYPQIDNRQSVYQCDFNLYGNIYFFYVTGCVSKKE